MRLHCGLKSGLWVMIPMVVFLAACDPVLHPELPNPAVANAADICIPPSTPTDLGLVVEADQIRLGWATDETALAGFVIERRLFLDPTWGELTRTEDPQPRVFVDLSADLLDAQYGYRLRAFQRVGDFECASPATEEKVATTFPKPPQQPHVQAFADRIELSWLDPNDFEMGYRIERRRQELDRDFLLVAELDRNGTRWLDIEPEAGHIYDYHIYAVNRSGESQVVSLSAPAILAARVPSTPILSWAGEPELDTQCGLHLAANAVFDDALGAVYDDENSQWSVDQALGTNVQAPSEAEQSFALDAQLAPFSGSFSAQWDVVDSLGSQAQLERRMQMSTDRTSLVRDRLPTASMGDDDGAGRQVLLPGCSDCQGERGSLAVGDHHACVLREGGRVQCWGDNYYGELGNGFARWENKLGTVCRGRVGEPCVEGLQSIAQMALGEDFSCARLDNGELRCWGDNGTEMLATGSRSENLTVPTRVCLSGSQEMGTCEPFMQVSDLTTSESHACAVHGAGELDCWGSSGDKLGVGELDSSLNPVKVCEGGQSLDCSTQLSGVTKVVTGGDFVCALLADSSVRCWGSNSSGRTGVGHTNPVILASAVCAEGSAPENNCVQLTGVVDLEVGDATACALLPGGRLACWGNGWDGQIGNGTDESSSNPSMVCLSGSQSTGDCVPLRGVVSFSLGEDHSCAVVETGEAYCWGYYTYGRLGSGLTHDVLNPTPVCLGGAWDGSSCVGELDTFASLTGVRSIAAGTDHSCAILDDTSVQCWGYNENGALGDGSWDDRDHPVQVCTSGSTDGGDCVPLTGALELALGDELSCARMLDGGVKCWGLGDSGMLGDGGENSYTYYPVDVCASGTGASCVPLTGATGLSAWGKRACASLSGGELLCWGDNRGYLGDGSTTDQYNPVPVCLSGSSDLDCVALSNANSFSIGNYQGCAVDSADGVWCWGNNNNHQLGAISGDNNTVKSPKPVCQSSFGVDCQPLSGVVQAAAGIKHTCAIVEIDNVNEVRCWGYGYYGALGQGLWENSAWPVAVCASGSWDGEQCSGENFSGVTQIVSGDDYSCVLHDDSTVWCWGSGYTAGDQSGYDTSLPVHVCVGTSDDGLGCIPLAGVTQLSGGSDHVCAVLADGSLKCWGLQNDGRLGDGTIAYEYRDGAVDVCLTGHYEQGSCTGEPLTQVTAVTTGEAFTCALQSSGQILCWGKNNNGQLGFESDDAIAVPSVVCTSGSTEKQDCVPLDHVVAVEAGFIHACALQQLDDGEQRMVCWGHSTKGQLGSGSGTISSYPTDVCETGSGSSCVPLSGAVQLAAGSEHTCALMQNGQIKCWGDNVFGQLGGGLDWREEMETSAHSGQVVTAFASPQTVCSVGNNLDGTCVALTQAQSISAGKDNTCATLTGGRVTCWGENLFGQVGQGFVNRFIIGDSNGYISPVSHPSLVCREGRGPSCLPLENARSVEVGKGHICALTEAGRMLCWGRDDFAQTGVGEPSAEICSYNSFSGALVESPCRLLPEEVCSSGTGSGCDKLRDVYSMKLGEAISCVILKNGTAKCWGENQSAQFADGTNLDSMHPQAVLSAGPGSPVLSGVAGLAVGDFNNCWLNQDGEIFCAGFHSVFPFYSGSYGYLGIGQIDTDLWNLCYDDGNNAYPCLFAPRQVCERADLPGDGCDESCAAELTGVTAFDTGMGFSCALKQDGAVYCWGENYYGQLANGNSGENSRCQASPICAYRENGLCVAPEPASVATCDLYSVTEVQ